MKCAAWLHHLSSLTRLQDLTLHYLSLPTAEAVPLLAAITRLRLSSLECPEKPVRLRPANYPALKEASLFGYVMFTEAISSAQLIDLELDWRCGKPESLLGMLPALRRLRINLVEKEESSEREPDVASLAGASQLQVGLLASHGEAQRVRSYAGM